jgi:hypothetical protein
MPDKVAWDAQPSRAAPPSQLSSWYASRGAPGTNECTTLKVRTITAKDPVVLSDLSNETTIAEVKRAVGAALHLSNRKKTTLRWYGAALEDDEATLQDLHIPNDAQLDAVFRTRLPQELDEFKTIKHVLMVDLDGNALTLEGVSNSTEVGAIKAMLKAPPTALVYFSPVFTSTFGTPLADERTLGSFNVLDGDVLYYSTGVPPEPAADAAPPKKK